MKPPGDLMVDLPWYDGRVIYKSGDEAVPMAIAVTEADAAAIVTALAAVTTVPGCSRMRDPGDDRLPLSVFCERPAVAQVPGAGGGLRCMACLAAEAGASVVPVDHHPHVWTGVRRLLAAWELPPGQTREIWVDWAVGDLGAMRVGYRSRFRDDEMPPLPVSREDARIMRQGAPARMEAARGRTFGDGEHFVRVPGGDWALASDVLDAEGHPSETLAHLFAAAGDLATTADALYDRLDSANYVASVAKDTTAEVGRQRDEARARATATEAEVVRLRAELEALRPKPTPPSLHGLAHAFLVRLDATRTEFASEEGASLAGCAATNDAEDALRAAVGLPLLDGTSPPPGK